MKPVFLRRLLWIFSICVLFLGLVLSARSIRILRETRRFLHERASELRALEEKAAEMQRGVAARKAYERIPGKRAVRLESLLRQALEGSEPDDVRESRVNVVDDWILRRKEVVFGDVDMARIMTLVRQAEAQRPPWLLAACVLRASPLTPGRGRAVLTFEVLERSSSTSP